MIRNIARAMLSAPKSWRQNDLAFRGSRWSNLPRGKSTLLSAALVVVSSLGPITLTTGATGHDSLQGVLADSLGVHTTKGEQHSLHLRHTSDAPNQPFVLRGQGFVLDSSHPMRPGDSRRYPLELKISVYGERDEFAVAVSDSGDTTSRPDVWYVRGTSVSHADSVGIETVDASIGDLRPEAVAVLHPAMLRAFVESRKSGSKDPLTSRAANLGWDREGPPTITDADQPSELHRTYFDERVGDCNEAVIHKIAFTGERIDPDFHVNVVTQVERNGRMVAEFLFPEAADRDVDQVPRPGPQRIDVEDRNTIHQLAPGQVHFTEIVPHVFTLDLDSLNTRVTVAEFQDSLVVLEGAFGSGVCDVLAQAVRERFHKPVRLFAFSHLHGQYSGGTRSWVHEGATVAIPPTTEPLIHQMYDAPFKSHPDALARDPKPLHIVAVPEHLHLEDGMNALDIYNVPSGHTDEYFLFHFPRQRLLLTGDLMFLRPGTPFGGRSKNLGQTVAKLGLAVDTYVASWPLHGFGTKSIVTAQEFQAALEGAQ